MDNPLYDPQVLTAIGAVIAAAVSYALLMLARYIGRKTKMAWAQDLAMSLRRAAVTAVEAVAQTYVSDIREARADGKLTTEEKEAAKAKALAKMKSMVSLSELIKLFGSEAEAQDALESELEAAVGAAKDPLGLL